MATLNLKISGLCGLVPNEFVPPDPPTQPAVRPSFPIRRMRVLVLDAARLAERHGLQICTHHPRLTVGSGANAQVFDLNGHRIEIEGLASGQPVRLFPEFWDVAQINQITPEPFRVADGFLTTPPGVTGLVASLRLATGDVIGIEPLSQEQVFANGYRKNFSQAVHVSLQLAGPGKIHLAPFFSTNPPPPPIDLIPGAGGSIDVTLSNLCDPSPGLLGGGDAEEAEEAEGTDFATFYGLLHEYHGELYVPKVPPKPSRRSPGEIQGGASTVESGCIPSLFSDHPNA